MEIMKIEGKIVEVMRIVEIVKNCGNCGSDVAARRPVYLDVFHRNRYRIYNFLRQQKRATLIRSSSVVKL